MSKQKIDKLFKQLSENPEFKTWKELPPNFFTDTAVLSPEEALDLAGRLWKLKEHRFLYAAAFMLRKHPSAFTRINWKVLKPLGNLMDSWGAVDLFAYLAGPAWREGQLSDEQVLQWTQYENRWWRRAALVCTVFLNRKAQGGSGDTKRTLPVCARLVDDRDKMVVKALSWALRELTKTDPKAVEKFMQKYDPRLPSLVKREVRNKLTTGVKNPRREKNKG